MKGSYLFRHIIHRSLLIGQEKKYDQNNLFLSDMLYLSLFLENLVIQPTINIKEFPQIKITSSPYKTEFYEQYDIRNKTFLPYYLDELDALDQYDFDYTSGFEIDDDYLLKGRIQNDPILKGLDGIMDVNFIKPKLELEFKEVYELGKKIEDEFGDYDLYTAFALSELMFASNNDYSIVPDKSAHTKEAFNKSKIIIPKETDELILKYKNISQSALKDLIKLYRKEQKLKKQIKLPPITSIIFNESNNIDDILKICLQMRTSFSELRMAFNDYENTIRNTTLSLGQRLNALNELEYFAEEFSKKYPQHSPVNVSDLSDLSSFGRLADQEISAADGSSILNSLMKKPLKYVGKKARNRKVQYLFNIQTQFYKIKNYEGMIEKIFNRKITNEEVINAMKEGFNLDELL